MLLNPKFLHIKLAGGATAQCLGLMNAIYASKKLNMPFKISYYPYSTGTYWPFAIDFLLDKSEKLNTNIPTRGLHHSNQLQVGNVIKSHPLFQAGISYEKFLSYLRKIHLDTKLQLLRRELEVRAAPHRLLGVNKYFTSISGGFAQINETVVNSSMDSRFKKANKKSPFAKKNNDPELTIIHYRLGDKKATPAQMQHTIDFNSDLIIHPEAYAELLQDIPELNKNKVFVVSDEPLLAQKLLAGVGVNAKIYSNSGNIWEDLCYMSCAGVFIGSKSQVSQLANICVENNGGKSYLLNFSKHLNYSNFRHTTYLSSKFLDPKNKIYSLDSMLEKNSHAAYQSDSN